MVILRLFVYLALIAIIISLAAFLVTRNTAYLRFSWQILKFSTVLLLIMAAIFAMGRIILG